MMALKKFKQILQYKFKFDGSLIKKPHLLMGLRKKQKWLARLLKKQN